LCFVVCRLSLWFEFTSFSAEAESSVRKKNPDCKLFFAAQPIIDLGCGEVNYVVLYLRP
jgi:hypothetical protein